MWDESLAQVTSAMWEKNCHHVERLILEAYQFEFGKNAPEIKPIVIHFGPGGDISDSDEDNPPTPSDGGVHAMLQVL